MDKDKKERLFVAASFAAAIALGATFELVKVPVKTQEVTVETVDAEFVRTAVREDGAIEFGFVVPEGYTFQFEDEPIGYKKMITEKTEEIKLSEYLLGNYDVEKYVFDLTNVSNITTKDLMKITQTTEKNFKVATPNESNKTLVLVNKKNR